MKKDLKPGKDYTYQFITKEKGVIKTNDLNVVYDLILHDKDGIPAYQDFYPNGKLWGKTHFKDNKWHNLNGVARVFYNKDGEITREYYYIEGVRYTKEQWQEKVKELTQNYKYQFICKNKGIIKTNDFSDIKGLALHDKNGEAAYKEFYSSGTLYYKSHCKDDKFHNLEGASRVYYNEKGEITDEYYYIEGVEYTKEEWEEKVKELKSNNMEATFTSKNPQEIKRLSKSTDMALFISELVNNGWRDFKHTDYDYSKAWGKIHELIDKYNINIEELI